MTEQLYFDISAFYKNGHKIHEATCTLILGPTTVDSQIPTRKLILVRTETLDDNEPLLIYFQQNDNIVAKLSTNLWHLRKKVSLPVQLETLGEGDNIPKDVFSWTHAYHLVAEDKNKYESIRGKENFINGVP